MAPSTSRKKRGIPPKQIQSLKNAERATDLRARGYSYSEIAEALELKNSEAAARLVRASLKRSRERCHESAVELVQIDLERLDFLWRQVALKIEESKEVEASTLKVGVDILARREKLLGLEAPQQVSHDVKLSLSATEAENTSDIGIAIAMLQKCFIVHGESPLELAKRAIVGLGESGRPLLPQENIPDAEFEQE
jgi:DNA-binding transcriptional MerR regulator